MNSSEVYLRLCQTSAMVPFFTNSFNPLNASVAPKSIDWFLCEGNAGI